MVIKHNKPNFDSLLAQTRTAKERKVLSKWAKNEKLTDDEQHIIDLLHRRLKAKSPEQRARLNRYNRLYTARRRRIDKGIWPKDAPTVSKLVKLGYLPNTDVETDAYVSAVETYLSDLDSTQTVQTNMLVITIEDSANVLDVDSNKDVDSNEDVDLDIDIDFDDSNVDNNKSYVNTIDSILADRRIYDSPVLVLDSTPKRKLLLSRTDKKYEVNPKDVTLSGLLYLVKDLHTRLAYLEDKLSDILND